MDTSGEVAGSVGPGRSGIEINGAGGPAHPQRQGTPTRTPGGLHRYGQANMAWLHPPAPETANHGGMAAGVRVGVGLGGDRRVHDRYHEHTSRSKRAAGARKEMAPAQLMPA